MARTVCFQVTCGAELALLLVEALSKFEIPFGEEPLGEKRSCFSDLQHSH